MATQTCNTPELAEKFLKDRKFKLCHTASAGEDVTLWQGPRRTSSFAVQYGCQVYFNLSYDHAARELGASMMRALACNSVIDNERD